jgi:PAS domain S-box-containing protein
MDKQEYIQDSSDKLFTLWLRRVVVFGALMFLFLSLLDFVVFREHLARFLVYRIVAASFLLLISVLAGKTANKTVLRALALAAVAASAVTIEVMILQTGGHHSPYATGMILLAVTALVFVPADFPFHVATAAVIYGIYLLPIIMAERVDDILTFFTTTFFMCSIILTVVIFRYLSMQSLRKQLGAEYELIVSGNRLQESEDYFRSIAEVSEIVIFRLSVLGEVSYVSPPVAEQFGYEPKDAMGRHFLDFVMPVSYATANAVFQVLLSGQSVRDTDLQLRRADGSSFEATINMTPVIHNGEVLEAQGIIINITKRKKAEEEVRRLAVEQRIILDNIASGVFFLKSRTVIWANMKAATMFDYSLEEILGKNVSMFYPDREGYEELGMEAYSLLPRGKTYSVDRQMKKKGGEIIWCSLVGQAVNVLDPDQGSIWLLDNITERKLLGEELKKYQTQLEEMVAARTAELEHTIALLGSEAEQRTKVEKELENSEKQFRTIIETSNEGIIIHDLSIETALYVNQAFANMLGKTTEELIGQHISELHPPDAMDHVYTEFQKHSTGEKSRSADIPFLHKDGSLIYADVSSNRISMAGADLQVAFFRDVTERRKAQEALKENHEIMRGSKSCLITLL